MRPAGEIRVFHIQRDGNVNGGRRDTNVAQPRLECRLLLGIHRATLRTYETRRARRAPDLLLPHDALVEVARQDQFETSSREGAKATYMAHPQFETRADRVNLVLLSDSDSVREAATSRASERASRKWKPALCHGLRARGPPLRHQPLSLCYAELVICLSINWTVHGPI